MPSDFEMMIERYKAELMRYQNSNGSQPQSAPEPMDAPRREPMELPQAEPTDTPQPMVLPEPTDTPQPMVLPEPPDRMLERVVESDIPVEFTPTRELVGTEVERSNDEGYLSVRVSTADNALPVEGALVTVTDKRGNLVAVMLTDSDGATRSVGLPTLPRSESQSPELGRPFDTYNLEVRRRGYIDFRSENIPIFGGVTNTQSVSLIPLPEFESDRTQTAQNTEPF